MICTPACVEDDINLCLALNSISSLCDGRSDNAILFQQSSVFWVQLKVILETRIDNATSASVAVSCLRAIRFLCRSGELRNSSNDNNIRLLGEIRACEIVTEVFETFNFSAEVIVEAYFVVQFMSCIENNSAKFGSIGVCEVVVRTLEFHIINESVAEKGCDAIFNLSRCDENNAKLGVAGVCKLMVRVLEFHISNVIVIEKLFDAIVNLACNVGNRNHFGSLGICELMVQVLEQRIDNIAIVSNGCDAIHNLSCSSENSIKFGSCGCCKLLLDIFNRHIRNESIVNIVSQSIKRLAHSNVANQERFIDCGARLAVLRAMEISFLRSKCNNINSRSEISELFALSFVGDGQSYEEVR